MARRLAERGVAVRVLEAGPRCASGASGIPASMAHARLLGDGSAAAQLRSHAYLHSTHALESLRLPASEPSCEGALQLPRPDEPPARLDAVGERYQATGNWVTLLDRADAVQRANWPVTTPALWFPHSRALSSATVCELLLEHPNISLRCDHRVAELPTKPDVPVVLACAEACRQLPGAEFLELANVHGQIDFVELPAPPAVPIVGNGYLVPWGGQLAIGSTYEYSHWAPGVATQRNLAQLTNAQRSQVRTRSVARGTRCVSSDRLPVVGRLFDQQAQPLPGRYVLTGLGSMGNVMSHYCAELLASQICGEFAPAQPGLLAALSPLRFRQRQARRGYRLQARL